MNTVHSTPTRLKVAWTRGVPTTRGVDNPKSWGGRTRVAAPKNAMGCARSCPWHIHSSARIYEDVYATCRALRVIVVVER